MSTFIDVIYLQEKYPEECCCPGHSKKLFKKYNKSFKFSTQYASSMLYYYIDHFNKDHSALDKKANWSKLFYYFGIMFILSICDAVCFKEEENIEEIIFMNFFCFQKIFNITIKSKICILEFQNIIKTSLNKSITYLTKNLDKWINKTPNVNLSSQNSLIDQSEWHDERMDFLDRINEIIFEISDEYQDLSKNCIFVNEHDQKISIRSVPKRFLFDYKDIDDFEMIYDD